MGVRGTGVPHATNGKPCHLLAVDHDIEIAPSAEQLVVIDGDAMHLSPRALDKCRGRLCADVECSAGLVETLVGAQV